ncbi:MAG: hypothetical protein HZB53_09905 [Chloroflexi bacterium]|nr:hypothetical protein [Chloroflexota bacterium]
MDYLLTILVIFGVLVFVGYPLANPRRYTIRKFVTMGDPQYENLASAREQAFDALRDFEFDHATGKLSESDYKNLRTRYETRAATILQQIDTLTATQSAAPAANAPKRRAKTTPAANHVCPQCQAPAEAGDRFCMKCGAKI